MKRVKSERLKKLETELQDLQQWLKLGLVPKKDIVKHEEEIRSIQAKVEEEVERIQFLKESGDEELPAGKRTVTRATTYTELPTLPDIDLTEGPTFTEGSFQEDSEYSTKTDTKGTDTSDDEETVGPFEDSDDEEESESYFSDKNRWRRGGIVDPDADEW